MNEQQTAMVKRSLTVKFTLLIAVLVIFFLAGNWFSFQQSKKILLQEIETRGIWIARNLAYSVGYGAGKEDERLLDELIEGILHEDDVMYVVIVNQNDEIMFSKSKQPEQTFMLPDSLRQVSCNGEEPIVHTDIMYDQQLYDVRTAIVQRGSQQNNEDNLTEEQQEENNVKQASQATTSRLVCLGTVHIGMSLKNLDKKLTQILSTFVLLSVFIIIVGVIGYRIASRMLVIPILQMADVATQISKGDLRQTIEITSSDEVGILETALSRILEASKIIAARLKAACDKITIVSDEMLSISEEQSSVSQKQSASIYHISRTIEEIANSSRAIAENSDSVAKIAEATLQATRDVEETVKNTITGMKEIKDQVGKNSERVVHLGEKISQIGNVVKIINTIADQTKLIAFNASIEAAGAGETGGRFSIVATEVRRLANTVVESLEEIRDSVSSIQSATSELILSSETGIRKVNQGAALIAETGTTLQQIMEMIDKTTQSAKEISISTQRQQAEHGQIVEEIKEIADGSEQSVDMSKRTTEIAKELRNLANKLDIIVQNFIT
jgi:methyl-accepting chemotaxis protein